MSERDTRVAEIRARWAADGPDYGRTVYHATKDIAWLLAEVERLAAERDRARIPDFDGVRRHREEMQRTEELLGQAARERDAAIRERDEARLAQACAEEAIDEWQEERASLWARVKTAEELCAAHVADISKAVTDDLAATTRERDEARAEMERLRAVEAAAKAYLAILDGPFDRDITEDDIAAFRAALRGETPCE